MKSLYFNKAELRDKILACWIGKNIGGTLGAPYEGCREVQDVKGFVTPEGETLPNDDLDLQLVWLKALENYGPDRLDSRVLGEYWLDLVGPNWNEYGICKANLRKGFLAPLSGELFNEEWKHSNGAWIRTEIWACTNPADVENAIRLAYTDASVDHGHGEGTFAAVFVAALESAAFVLNDPQTLLDIALSKIPEDCRVSRCVRVARQAYADGLSWLQAREAVMAENGDLGWFQAPANIAFVTIGLLYGEGDFKKTLITAVNCGDDTDCTGATLGSLMGILHGTAGIPQDWRQHIGDKITTVAMITGKWFTVNTCEQLTDCVMRMIPAMTRRNMDVYLGAVEKTEIVLREGETDLSALDTAALYGREFCDRIFTRSPYHFTISGVSEDYLIEFNAEPIVAAGGHVGCKISVFQRMSQFNTQAVYELKWHLPEGWRVDGPRHVFVNEYVNAGLRKHEPREAQVRIIAGDQPAGINRILLEIDREDSIHPMYIPLTILG